MGSILLGSLLSRNWSAAKSREAEIALRRLLVGLMLPGEDSLSLPKQHGNARAGANQNGRCDKA
jgi:hypothetical protein